MIKHRSYQIALSAGTALVLLASAQSAVAQEAATPETPAPEGASAQASATQDAAGGGEIVVTANKRVENLQKVGLSVQAVGAAALANQQVDSLSEIAQIVPGLTFAQSANNTPVYTLRGVGFFESSLAAYPDVSLYIDQVPLPFPTTATLAAFDLERLEVLKGPQGTLFGNNATGGAINYIAAKPSSRFGAGIDVSYSRFNTLDLSGYVTGPLSDTINARLAVKITKGDEWQKSYTRNDSLGEVNTIAGRFLLDWQATDRLKIAINLNGWRDKSDPIAPQYTFFRPQQPVPPTFPMGVYPRAPQNARAADWSTNLRPEADNRLLQGAVRADYDLTDDITLTSITSYVDYKHDQVVEGDGTALNSLDTPNSGRIKSFSQELRIGNGGSNALRWLVGANYEHSNVLEVNAVNFANASTGSGTVGTGFFQAGNSSDQKMRNYAGFANLEYDITDQLTLKGGIRRTRAERRSANATYDLGDGGTSALFTGAWSFYRQVLGLGGPIPLIPIGDSVSADPATGLPGLYQAELNENSTSWSAGVNFKPTNDVLLYANVSKGFKAGSFPTVSAAQWSQYFPVVQESLLDYELGFKAQMFDRKLTVNGAAFYYDYKNKQLRAKIVDGFFGILDGLVNVPRSTIKGAEIEITVRPVDGLTLNGAATYLDTKVNSFQGVVGAQTNPSTGLLEPVLQSLAGSKLPFSPKWQATAGFDYEAPLSAGLKGFLGANVSYQSRSTSVLVGGPNVSDYDIKARALVGGRIGIGDADERWKLTLWGKNIFNKYYWTNAIATFDNVVRYPGRPAEYGVTASLKF